MIGILLNDLESKEFHYVLRKELDEMLLDLQDDHMDPAMKHSVTSRYRTVFRMYARLASPKELSRYALQKHKL